MAITLDGTTGITTADIAATTLTVNAGFGSNATAYGVRAWVNFNGTGTVAIRDSGNVSSITDNGVGDYTVNFATNMPDVNYCVSYNHSGQATGSDDVRVHVNVPSANYAVGSVKVRGANSANTFMDQTVACVIITR